MADRNFDGKLDSSEFKNVPVPTELEIAPKVPITPDLRNYMGQMDLQPGSYPGQLTVKKGELRAGAEERIKLDSEVYLTRELITDFHANFTFFKR